MELKEVFQTIINGGSVLITGSGANYGVKGIDGGSFPTGTELAEYLYREAGIFSPENPYDLQDASETYIETLGASSLIQLIKNKLMVSSITDSQKWLYDNDWQRIYTTNYDNVPTIATLKSKNQIYPVVLSSHYQKEYIREKTCVFI